MSGLGVRSRPHTRDGHTHELGETPVLDIGGDIGAALVRLDGDTSSGELFARPCGRPSSEFHTGVHHRHDRGRVDWVALFCEVVEGDYELLDDDGQAIARFAVVGGSVTEIDLRS